MRARFITRCGCQREMEVPHPPPPYFDFPLKPPVPNEGSVRSWLQDHKALQYDPIRDGLHRRRFKLSLESLDGYQLNGSELWYDETTDFDPSGYNADKRTYTGATTPTEEMKE